MLGMIVATGLAIDAGRLFNARRTAQEAADAAAFAGAIVLYQGGTAAQARSAATSDAALNGFAAGVPTANTSVTVNSPPTSGAFSGSVSYVEVIISTPVQTSLVPHDAALTAVRARAVAGNTSSNAGYSVMALDQSCTAGTLRVGPNGHLQADGGDVMVNSCSASDVSNSGQVDIDSAYCLDMVGGTAVGSLTTCQRTGQPVAPDPFAGTAKPSTNGLLTYAPGCGANLPGIYTTSFSSNCAYTLAAGTYILKGGGVSLAGNSSLSGTGVFIYLTNSNYPATGGSCATWSLAGNNDSTLSAPTSGTYAGLLVWQDSACSGAMTFGGNAHMTTSGTIYAPSATVTGNGNNAELDASQIGAKQASLGNTSFHIVYSSGTTYQGRIPALVE